MRPALAGAAPGQIVVDLLLPGTAKLGEIVEATVSVKNDGKESLTIFELWHDVQSVELDIAIESPLHGEKIGPFRFTKIHRSVFDPQAFREKILEPGKMESLGIDIPAILPGKMRVTARFNGQRIEDVLPFAVVSPTREVTVEAEEGTELMGRLKTRKGEMVFAFCPEEAPATVMHFVLLAKKEYYDGLLFHRVVESFVIQTGCPQGNGSGDPGFNIPAEIRGVRKHVDGALGLARSEPMDSGGSQFYICIGPQETLDGWYTVFGELTSGGEVTRKIVQSDAVESLRVAVGTR
jgi:peptidyl-prolyl cis-trans isomerase B (cyclophilin B)